MPSLLFILLLFLPTSSHVLLSDSLLRLTPLPATICCLARGPLTARRSSLRATLKSISFWLRPPPLKQMRRRLGILNQTRTIGLITHYFRVRSSCQRGVKSCPNPTPSPVYSSSGSNSVNLVCISFLISETQSHFHVYMLFFFFFPFRFNLRFVWFGLG